LRSLSALLVHLELIPRMDSLLVYHVLLDFAVRVARLNALVALMDMLVSTALPLVFNALLVLLNIITILARSAS